LSRGAIQSLGDVNDEFGRANFLQDIQLGSDLSDILGAIGTPFRILKIEKSFAYTGPAKIGGRIWKKQTAKAAAMGEQAGKSILADSVLMDAEPALLGAASDTADWVFSTNGKAAEQVVEMASESSASTYDVIRELQGQLQGLQQMFIKYCCK